MKSGILVEPPAEPAVPVWALTEAGLDRWLESRPAAIRQWVRTNRFAAHTSKSLVLPGKRGTAAGVLLGVGSDVRALDENCWVFAGLPRTLPTGTYCIRGNLSARQAHNAALGWMLGAYRFDRYKSQPDHNAPAKLVIPARCDRSRVVREAEATAWIRDLINTPAEDMGPADLERAALELASEFGATARVITGDELLDQGCRLVHTVGRASARAPRLIDLVWGPAGAAKLTLVGKGVCFDSGGLQIKADPGIRNMKADMGGAAHALGLARLIMASALPVRLRVLIPAVENCIGGNAYRPGDVVAARNGVTVQIEHTDAEGRLILADALAMADEDAPDLLIDFATLTGAVVEALGSDIPGVVCTDERTALDLIPLSRDACDQVWPLPLWKPYESSIESAIADVNHIADGFGAGVITAALFLRKFVSRASLWCHVDMSAWNSRDRPGRPLGGEARGLRAMFSLIERRYGRGGAVAQGEERPS